MAAGLTARQINAALFQHFIQRYAVITEVEAYEAEPTGGRPFSINRRCDVLLLSRQERLALEVKVSRADFLQDVRDPDKQSAWVRLTHRQAYVVPVGLVAVDEVPAGFGLLTVEVFGEGRRVEVKWARRAPKRPGHVPVDLPPRIVSCLWHRLSRAEAHAKGLSWGPTQSESAEQLRGRVERLQADLANAHAAKHRADDRARVWHRRFCTSNPPGCSTCGSPLLVAGRGGLSGWKHRPDDEAVCLPLREAEERTRRAEVDAADDAADLAAGYERVRRRPDHRHLYVPEPWPVTDPVRDEVGA